jgi:hypothetical protein
VHVPEDKILPSNGGEGLKSHRALFNSFCGEMEYPAQSLVYISRAEDSFMWLAILMKGFSKKKLHGLSPRANYTDRATAACWRSDCQLLRIEVATWSA